MESFDALTSKLFMAADERIGDTITVTRPGVAAVTIKAHVDYADELYASGQSAGTQQNMKLDFARSLFTEKPDDTWRIVFAHRPDETFQPRNVQIDVSGRRWELGLKLVPS